MIRSAASPLLHVAILFGVCHSYQVNYQLSNDAQPLDTWLMISSPNYPSPYPNSVVAGWGVPAYGETTIIQIDFIYFETEENHDFVYIFDGYNTSYPLLASISGFHSSLPSYYTTQNYVFVEFTSDNETTYKGFQAKLTPILPEDLSTAISATKTSTGIAVTASTHNWIIFVMLGLMNSFASIHIQQRR